MLSWDCLNRIRLMEAMLGQPEGIYGTCDRGLPSRNRVNIHRDNDCNEFYRVRIDSETGDFHAEIVDREGKVLYE